MVLMLNFGQNQWYTAANSSRNGSFPLPGERLAGPVLSPILMLCHQRGIGSTTLKQANNPIRWGMARKIISNHQGLSCLWIIIFLRFGSIVGNVVVFRAKPFPV